MEWENMEMGEEGFAEREREKWRKKEKKRKREKEKERKKEVVCGVGISAYKV